MIAQLIVHHCARSESLFTNAQVQQVHASSLYSVRSVVIVHVHDMHHVNLAVCITLDAWNVFILKTLSELHFTFQETLCYLSNIFSFTNPVMQIYVHQSGITNISFNSTKCQDILYAIKNSKYGRHWISWGVQIIAKKNKK